MNTHTFAKRISGISKFVKKDGHLSVCGKNLMGRMPALQSGDKIFPKYWRRSKGYCTLYGESEYNDMIELLNAAGIDYTTGNDAPRGGAEGDFIQLTANGRNKIKDIDFRTIR